jgi:hypothetical protein
MDARSPYDLNPNTGLTAAQEAQLFAQQAKDASVVSANYPAIDTTKSFKVRGPVWLVLPLATIVVVTVPFWFGPVLHSYGLIAAIFGAAISVFGFVQAAYRRVSKRKRSQDAKGGLRTFARSGLSGRARQTATLLESSANAQPYRHRSNRRRSQPRPHS